MSIKLNRSTSIREPMRGFTRRTHMKNSPRAALRAVPALFLALFLVSCGSAKAPTKATDSQGSAPAAAPSLATPTGKVTGLGMVIDQGNGTSLCLGPIAESYPPQCQGIPLVGWDWATRNDFEDISGVKFAMYAVTGTYDGKALTVTDEPISAALYDPLPDPSANKATQTRCPVPEGGWAIINRGKSNANALARAEKTATKLDGYVTHWNDLGYTGDIAVTKDTEPDPDPDMGDDGSLDPLKLILNVQVSGDVETATKLMRSVWGGALCVTNPQHSAQELEGIATELSAAGLGVSTAVPQYDRVAISVTFDDGSLQAWADDKYGADTVVIQSALASVG